MPDSPSPQRGDLFFAYGTLRPGAPMFRALGLAGRLIPAGPAAMRGALLSLGDYPGMVADARGRVHGVLYRVADPRVFAALDAYEEFFPDAPQRSLYLRVRAPLAGRRGRAWVYVWNGRRKGAPVPSGRWRG